jgi:hypothetical protein
MRISIQTSHPCGNELKQCSHLHFPKEAAENLSQKAGTPLIFLARNSGSALNSSAQIL